MDDRVKYYPPNDLAYGMGFDKIETIQIPPFESLHIDDVLEFYQFEKYLKDGYKLKSWTDSDIKKYSKKIKEMSGITRHFLGLLNDECIVAKYKSINSDYLSDFWELFDICRLYDKISPDVFANLLMLENVFYKYIFVHEKIVDVYSNILRDYIIENENGIHVLLSVYAQESNSKKK